MLSVDTDVLIAGAGFAGLVLACDLARRGVRFRIVEANAQPPDTLILAVTLAPKG